MTVVNTKEHIIEYFKSGIKSSSNFKIGIEHEKFLFDLKNNKRVDYNKIKLMFDALIEFWMETYFGDWQYNRTK